MSGNAEACGRTIVVGDIHGCNLALERLLEQLDLRTPDVFVVLGDAVDRGTGSREVLETLLQVDQACQLVYILGNHEEMLLDVLSGYQLQPWLRQGGAATLDSYGGSLSRIPDSHRDLLHRSVPYWESAETICVHANLEPGVELVDQQPGWLRWQQLTGFEFPHPSGKLVLCGHTGQLSGLPSVCDGWVCLDTLAYSGRFLTCLDVASSIVIQSRQSGEVRKFHLDDLTS